MLIEIYMVLENRDLMCVKHLSVLQLWGLTGKSENKPTYRTMLAKIEGVKPFLKNNKHIRIVTVLKELQKKEC